jgi:hypothetical protein
LEALSKNFFGSEQMPAWCGFAARLFLGTHPNRFAALEVMNDVIDCQWFKLCSNHWQSLAGF